MMKMIILKSLIREWSCRRHLLLAVLVILFGFSALRLFVESAELAPANRALSNADSFSSDDNGVLCILIHDVPDGTKIEDKDLRRYEEFLFGSESDRLCNHDIRKLIKIFRIEQDLVEDSRLSPQYRDIMDDLRWLDEISELKCRVRDYYDRALKISIMSVNHPGVKDFLCDKQREQNRLCLEELRSNMGDIIEGAYLTSEQLAKESPAKSQRLILKQKHKLVPEQRQVANFLRYNVETNNKDPSVKLHQFIPAETYYRGVAEYLLPRATKMDKSKVQSTSAKALYDAKLKHYESEFNRIVYEACDAVHREMNKFKNYFENLMEIGDLSESSIHQRILEAIANIQVCEVVVNKKYPFEGVFEQMLRISDENRDLLKAQKRPIDQ